MRVFFFGFRPRFGASGVSLARSTVDSAPGTVTRSATVTPYRLATLNSFSKVGFRAAFSNSHNYQYSPLPFVAASSVNPLRCRATRRLRATSFR